MIGAPCRAGHLYVDHYCLFLLYRKFNSCFVCVDGFSVARQGPRKPPTHATTKKLHNTHDWAEGSWAPVRVSLGLGGFLMVRECSEGLTVPIWSVESSRGFHRAPDESICMKPQAFCIRAECLVLYMGFHPSSPSGSLMVSEGDRRAPTGPRAALRALSTPHISDGAAPRSSPSAFFRCNFFAPPQRGPAEVRGPIKSAAESQSCGVRLALPHACRETPHTVRGPIGSSTECLNGDVPAPYPTCAIHATPAGMQNRAARGGPSPSVASFRGAPPMDMRPQLYAARWLTARSPRSIRYERSR
eukprot:5004825-Pyramimonas_sp.AAC.1